MLLQNIKDDGLWTYISYFSTWKYGWEFILKFSQIILLEDYKEIIGLKVYDGNTIDYSNEIISNKGEIENIKDLIENEYGSLSIYGISKTFSEIPIQFTLYNQTDILGLSIPSRKENMKVIELFKKGDNIFTQFLSSVEIKSYIEIQKKKKNK